MATSTRLALITAGCKKAGRTDAGVLTEAVGWLNRWLRSQYRSWPWPFLNKRRSGLVLTPGVQSILVGGGNSGITTGVKAVRDSFYLRTSTYTHRSQPRLVPSLDLPVEVDPDMVNTATQRGAPTQVQVRAGSSPVSDVWQLTFYPVPDQAYVLNFDYTYLPADLTLDADIPLYPNDRTVEQAVAAETLFFANGADDPSYQAALQILGSMVIDDRVKDGQIPGTNDVWGLDGGVFK